MLQAEEFAMIAVTVRAELAQSLVGALGDVASHMEVMHPLHHERSASYKDRYGLRLDLTSNTPQDWVTTVFEAAKSHEVPVDYVGKGGERVGQVSLDGDGEDMLLPNGMNCKFVATR